MISTGLVLSAILAAGVVASEWTAYPVAEAPAVDLGDRVGLLRPLVEQPICAPCHGPVERMSPAVKEPSLRVIQATAR